MYERGRIPLIATVTLILNGFAKCFVLILRET